MIDETDKKILAVLMKDAKKSYVDIGEIVNLSAGAVHVRVKKLEANGIIKGTGIIIDPHHLGWDISAFLGIYLDKSSLYEDVASQLQAIPEITGAHYTTGAYSIFAKIICRDTNHLRNVLHDKIQHITGLQRTETFISLEEGINRPLKI